MPPFHPLLLTLLLLLPTALAQTASQTNSDPGCNRGLAERGACCPPQCGTCGGVGCGTRGATLNSNCCPHSILSSARFCNSIGPPCKLTPTDAITTGSAQVTACRPSSTSGSWSTAPVSSGTLVDRHEACAVMVNGLVVLLGGRGRNKQVSVYNPQTKVWQNRPGPGQDVELHHMQCVAFGSKVYIVTSWRGGFPFEQNNDRVWIYDVATWTWSTQPGLPSWRQRGGAASVLRNGVVYVVGGNRGGHGAHAQTLGWMDAYIIAENRWMINLPTMPQGRDHTGGAMVNGQLCVAGGRNGGVAGFFSANVASVWCYNFFSRTWTRKADFPAPRAGAATGATCDGRMMVAGGEGNGRAHTRVDVFNGSSWQMAPFMVGARHGSGLAVAKCCCGQIFIPSGSGSQGGSPQLFTTERFVPTGRPWNCASY